MPKEKDKTYEEAGDFKQEWNETVGIVLQALIRKPDIHRDFDVNPVATLQRFGMSFKDEKIGRQMSAALKAMSPERGGISPCGILLDVLVVVIVATTSDGGPVVAATARAEDFHLDVERLRRVFDLDVAKARAMTVVC